MSFVTRGGFFFFLCLLLLLFAACESNEPGGIRLHYSWVDSEGNDITPPDLSLLFAWGELTYGAEIKTTEAVWLGDEAAQLRFENLPYGPTMKLTLTMRLAEPAGDSDIIGADDAPEARPDNVAYYCTSQEFSLTRGKVTEVENACVMQKGPALSDDNKPGSPVMTLFYEEASGDAVEITTATEFKTPKSLVSIAFTAPNDNFDTVIVANDTGFALGKKEHPKPTKGNDGKYRIAIHDLDDGLPVTGDGTRIVSLKLKNALDLESLPGSRTVTLDTTAPFLTVKSDATAYNGTGIVTVNLSSNETLKDLPTVGLYDEDDALIQDLTAEAEELQPGTSYRYQVTVHGNLTDGSYHLKATGLDIVENAAEPILSDIFTVDSIAPELDGDPLIAPTRIKAEQEYTVTFTTKDDMTGGAVTVIRKEETLTCTNEGKDYTCTGTGPAGDKDTVDPVIITLTDAAGNLASFNAGNLTIDRTAPAVSGDATVVVTKPAGCPLPSVTAAIDGSGVDVSFTVTEILGDDPVVRAVRDTDSVEFELNGQMGYFYTYRIASLDASTISDGSYSLEIFLEDEAGNSDTISFPTTGFDLWTVKPTAPAVDVSDKIVYKRIPWGSDATGGVKYFGIAAGAEAVDANAAWVYAYDGPDPDTAGEIGKTPVVNRTFAQFELNRSDRTDVYLATYDTACNRSDSVKVRDVEWTATMENKVLGSVFENPHTFFINGHFNGTLEQEPFFFQEAVLVPGDPIEQTGKNFWKQRGIEQERPAQREGHSLVYDRVRGKIMMFGGAYSNETWEWDWDQAKWSQIRPKVSPSARSGHAMVYDSARGKVILFGGSSGGNETWEWDGSNWSQRNPITQPSSRKNHAMVYDSARGKVILFGGSSGGNETWEWDGNNWILLNPTIKPSARSGHAMAYDSDRGKAVMFGGSSGGNETWEWDGAEWAPLDPVTKPAARSGHAMIYRSAQKKVVMLDVVSRNEVWEWDGENWSQKNPKSMPPKREGYSLTYDVVNDVVLLFGGRYLTGNDTWVWDGTNWREISLTNKPEGEFGAWGGTAMVYDSARNRAVLFNSDNSTIKNETWEWNGTMWYLMNPPASPLPRSDHAIAYDHGRGRTVLFGGATSSEYSDETWEWDGNDWEKKDPINKPAGRWLHAMAYDGVRGKMVLFGGLNGGGVSNNETWLWDGTNWTLLAPLTSPSARRGHSMTYDSGRGKVVLFGGYTGTSPYYNDETWEWDGADWTLIEPVNRPSARNSSSMAYDEARGVTVLFGGETIDGSDRDETWTWNGTDWMLHSPETRPSERLGAALFYDTKIKKVVLWGGIDPWDDGVALNDIWEWNGVTWEEPVPSNKPPEQGGPSLAYDEANKQVVMFGWRIAPNTWLWDGTVWRSIVSATLPLLSGKPAMVFDRARNKIVLFGGKDDQTYSNETWEWDGIRWTLLDPVHKPAARAMHAMAYDSIRERTVMFGGQSPSCSSSVCDDTWEWDGVDWIQKTTDTKPSKAYYAMVYDSFRGEVVLFGGSPVMTWVWDGATWIQKDSPNKPSYRSSHAMAYDAARGRTILFGGTSGGDETWEWDGENWYKQNPTSKPTARDFPGMAYDETRGTVVLYGGSHGSDETWEWISGGNDRAGQIMNVAWENSGITDDSTVTYQSVSVLFNAGGLGDITGTPTNGVDLLTWKHDRWVTVSSNTADPDNLAPVTWETTDPVEIQTLLNSGLRKFNFAVVPTAPNGFLTDMGKIATDYAEVVVRYRINEE